MKKIISILVMACMITGCAGLKPDELVKTDIQDNVVSTGTDIPEEEQNQEEGVSQQDEKEKQSGSQQSFISRHWGKGVVCIGAVIAVYYELKDKRQLREDKRQVTENYRQVTERINGIKNGLPAVVGGDVTEEGGSAEQRVEQANRLLGEGGQAQLLQELAESRERAAEFQRSAEANLDTMREIAGVLQQIKASWVDAGTEEETPKDRVVKVAEVVNGVKDSIIRLKDGITADWPENPIFANFLRSTEEAEPSLDEIIANMRYLIVRQQTELVQALADNQELQARLAPAEPAVPDKT